ncbi:collagen alpha-1(I) chain-like [Vulpes lagopus]|uniref:collagen alpha-1(I) chain-like n=1 Tax=Vulpes lagopus TaxID=494514 RepID=UPI001BC96E3C|nr:collagen alpha-1(I) chain-like [Vulpes lagopus]
MSECACRQLIEISTKVHCHFLCWGFLEKQNQQEMKRDYKELAYVIKGAEKFHNLLSASLTPSDTIRAHPLRGPRHYQPQGDLSINCPLSQKEESKLNAESSREDGTQITITRSTVLAIHPVPGEGPLHTRRFGGPFSEQRFPFSPSFPDGHKQRQPALGEGALPAAAAHTRSGRGTRTRGVAPAASSAGAPGSSPASRDLGARPAVAGETGRRTSNFALQRQFLETTRSPLAGAARELQEPPVGSNLPSGCKGASDLAHSVVKRPFPDPRGPSGRRLGAAPEDPARAGGAGRCGARGAQPASNSSEVDGKWGLEGDQPGQAAGPDSLGGSGGLPGGPDRSPRPPGSDPRPAPERPAGTCRHLPGAPRLRPCLHLPAPRPDPLHLPAPRASPAPRLRPPAPAGTPRPPLAPTCSPASRWRQHLATLLQLPRAGACLTALASLPRRPAAAAQGTGARVRGCELAEGGSAARGVRARSLLRARAAQAPLAIQAGAPCTRGGCAAGSRADGGKPGPAAPAGPRRRARARSAPDPDCRPPGAPAAPPSPCPTRPPSRPRAHLPRAGGLPGSAHGRSGSAGPRRSRLCPAPRGSRGAHASGCRGSAAARGGDTPRCSSCCSARPSALLALLLCPPRCSSVLRAAPPSSALLLRPPRSSSVLRAAPRSSALPPLLRAPPLSSPLLLSPPPSSRLLPGPPRSSALLAPPRAAGAGPPSARGPGARSWRPVPGRPAQRAPRASAAPPGQPQPLAAAAPRRGPSPSQRPRRAPGHRGPQGRRVRRPRAAASSSRCCRVTPLGAGPNPGETGGAQRAGRPPPPPRPSPQGCGAKRRRGCSRQVPERAGPRPRPRPRPLRPALRPGSSRPLTATAGPATPAELSRKWDGGAASREPPPGSPPRLLRGANCGPAGGGTGGGTGGAGGSGANAGLCLPLEAARAREPRRAAPRRATQAAPVSSPKKKGASVWWQRGLHFYRFQPLSDSERRLGSTALGQQRPC